MNVRLYLAQGLYCDDISIVAPPPTQKEMMIRVKNTRASFLLLVWSGGSQLGFQDDLVCVNKCKSMRCCLRDR